MCKKGVLSLFKKLFNFSKKQPKNSAEINAKLCVLSLAYDDDTETLNYGQCFTVNIVNISPDFMTIRHNHILEKGNILEFRTKYALEDNDCIKCLNYKSLSETPKFSSFIGRVVWQENNEAGVKIIMMREQDKAAILKMNTKNL